MNKKITTVALAGLMAVSTGASASLSRWGGLGAGAVPFVADVQDIWTLPTAVLDNADSLYVEFGTMTTGYNGIASGATPNTIGTSGAWGGANVSLFGGQLGLWSGGATSISSFGGAGVAGVGVGTVGNFGAGTGPTIGGLVGAEAAFAAPVRTLGLFYGMNVNDNMQVALGIDLLKDSLPVDTNSAAETVTPASALATDHNGSGFGINLGVGMSEAGPLSGLWAGVQYTSYSADYINTNDGANVPGSTAVNNNSTLSVSDIQLRVAAEMAAGDNTSGLFDINLNLESAETKRSAKVDASGNDAFEVGEGINETEKNSNTTITVGSALMKSGENGFGLLGLSVISASGKDEYTGITDAAGDVEESAKNDASTLAVTWTAAGEAKAFKDWLTLRAGVTGTLLNTASVERTRKLTGVAANAATVTTVDTAVPAGVVASVGFGVAMGDFLFDAVLNRDFLYSGPYFLSGAEAGLGSQVSLTYAFGGEE